MNRETRDGLIDLLAWAIVCVAIAGLSAAAIVRML